MKEFLENLLNLLGVLGIFVGFIVGVSVIFWLVAYIGRVL